MADILFHAGPCDGTRADYDEEQVTAGITTCKGTVYVVYRVGDGTYLGLLPGARPPHEAEPTGPTGSVVPDDALSAWHDFNRRVGHGVAEHVNATAAIRRGIRNTVR